MPEETKPTTTAAPQTQTTATTPPAPPAPPAKPAGAPQPPPGTQAKEDKPGQSPDAKTQPEPKADEKLSITPPTDSLLDAASAERFAAFAKARGLTSEQAQAIFEHQSGEVRQYVDAQVGAFNDQIKKWGEEVERHPELGGARLKESDESATRALEKFAPKGLVEELQKSGYAKYPPLFEMLVRIGRAMKEDSLHAPTSAQPEPPKSLHEKLRDRYRATAGA